jgi:hypothetical protein
MYFRGPGPAMLSVDKYIKVLQGIDTSQTKKSYYRGKIIDVMNCFGLPLPGEIYLSHSSRLLLALTLQGIFRKLVNSQYITHDMTKKMSEAAAKLNIDVPKNAYSYRLRALAPNGIYPNEELKYADANYLLEGGRPYLLTKNHVAAEEKASGGGDENSVLTRREVKIMSSFMCANGLIVKFSLEDDFDFSNVLDINAGYLAEVLKEDIPQVIFEYAAICNKQNSIEPNAFHFTVVGDAIDDIKIFYKNFRIDDLLLLRTCYLLIKASSMALTPNYFEDAVSNLFISLEGIMTLLQRNAGKRYESIDKEYQKTIYADIFGEGSESVYDFVMDEVFARGEKRASLVHPQAASEWGWIPFLMGGDYPEYRQILRCMIYYAVTDIRYDPYEYWAPKVK